VIYLVIFQHIVHNQLAHGQSKGTEDLKIIVAMVEPRTAIQDHYFFFYMEQYDRLKVAHNASWWERSAYAKCSQENVKRENPN